MIPKLSEEELQRTQVALFKSGGNITEAAKFLGIPRQTMSNRKRILENRPLSSKSPINKHDEDGLIKIFVLPDAQVKKGVDISHLTHAGEFVAQKKPDVIVCIGDFADMESLSSYDQGKKSFEGRTYKADIDAAKRGMSAFLAPINRQRMSGYNPRMVLTLGNHENRIERAVELDRKLDGTIGIKDLGYEKFGWEVYPFLQPVEIGGVIFCHYLISGVMGRAVQTASALLSKKHQSCVVGHQQGRQVAYATRADGSHISAIIAGSFYSHDEKFMGPQGNKHWRGVLMLHEVQNGSFDEMFVSLNFLKGWYERLKERK